MRWLALALVLLGCDGLGAPVVDVSLPPPDGEPYMCEPGLDDCDTPFVPTSFATPVPVTPSCEAPTQTCVDATQGRCVLALRVVAGTPVELPPQDCVALDLDTAPGSVEGELHGSTLTSSRVTLHAEQPTTFVFSDAAWSGVSVELRGPVSLRISGRLQNVSFVGDGDVTLADAKATNLAVALPGGNLRVQRSDLTDARLEVRELVLETVTVSSVWAQAERLIGIEVDGKQLRLSTSDLSLAELSLREVELHRCNSALVVNSSLAAAKLGACSEVMRLHNVAIIDGTLQGYVESEATLFSGTMFGPGGASTSVRMMFGTLSGDKLCAGLRRLEISDGTSTACNDCTDLAHPEQQLCRRARSDAMAPLAGALPTTPNDYCPIFDTGLPACGN